MIKKILLIAAVLFPMLASAQSLKVGIVDTNSIVMGMPDTKEAQNKIAEVSKQYDEAYQSLGEELKRIYEELQNMSETELPAIRERKQREFTDCQQKIQQFEQTASQDLQKLQGDLMMPIFNKVKVAIESVAKEGGYSLVEAYDPQTVLYYAAPVIDITSEVKTKLGI